MEEGPEESVEAEEEEVSEAPPRKGRRTLIVVAAVVIVVALIAGIVVYLLFQNSPPQPSFVATSVDLHLSVNAESTADPDGDSIANYSWNFGDAGSSTNLVTGANKVAATHDYTTIGKYTVTLTVVDSRGLGASTNQVITIVILPTPYFIARQSGMTTSFDGSGSFATGNKTIAAYQWTFGDGQTLNTGQTPTTTHQYTTPGRYNVTLTVTDSGGTNNSVSHWVSVNTSTVDVLADQFFQAGCPYGQWWNLRFHTYGDVLPAPSNSLAPCTDFYPWVLYSQSQAATNPSWVYTLYHLDMQATDNLGYNLGQPVVLPVFNYSAAPGQYIYYNFTFKYLDSQSISYWDTTPWPVSSKYSDGFGYLVIGNITMDLQESRRIFGVVGGTPAQAQAWWNASTKPGSLVGPLENKTGAWLDQLGNGKYDIYNAFQWYYESDIADLNATVNPTTGQTNVKVFFDGWGWDVLMARWFYWGTRATRPP